MSQGDFDTLTEALHAMTISSRQSKQIASTVGKGYVVLLNELNPNNEANKLGADLVLPLMLAAGSDEPLRWLCARMHRACVPLPQPWTSAGSAERTAILAVKEFGDVMREYSDALASGNAVDRVELAAIRREAHEAVGAILGFVLSLEQEG